MTTVAQRLKFDAEIRSMLEEVLQVFAVRVLSMLNRGRVYRKLVDQGASSLKITNAAGMHVAHLRKAARIAETYGPRSHRDLYLSARLAVTNFGLNSNRIDKSIESDAALLSTMDLSSPFAHAVDAWQDMEASSEPPPIEFVKFPLTQFWGDMLTREEILDLAGILAGGFPQQLLPQEHALSIVAPFEGQGITEVITDEVANRAVRVAQNRYASGTPDSSESSERSPQQRRGPFTDVSDNS